MVFRTYPDPLTSFEAWFQYLGSQISVEEFENLGVKSEVNEEKLRTDTAKDIF